MMSQKRDAEMKDRWQYQLEISAPSSCSVVDFDSMSSGASKLFAGKGTLHCVPTEPKVQLSKF